MQLACNGVVFVWVCLQEVDTGKHTWANYFLAAYKVGPPLAHTAATAAVLPPGPSHCAGPAGLCRLRRPY